ncbi:MAG TPA: response regulator transcription factor [Candidatus Acidoferrales bacterium]|nr:response regulator transcription factor [Candidatus Acidoferrales bacterium]
MKPKQRKEQGSSDAPNAGDGAGPLTMTTKETYRVLIADDHAIVRRGLRALLASQPGIEVCSEASSGTEALDGVRKEKPDLLVLDLTMPEMNGLQVARAVREESPTTDILILSVHFSEEVAREVLRSGAIGYVLKSDADTELLSAVDHARHHQPFFTGKLAVSMAEIFMQDPGEPAEPPVESKELAGTQLTGREVQVIQLLADGKSNKQVADTLGVSVRTVESHRNHIMRKMNFTSFSDLIRFAIRANLIEP